MLRANLAAPGCTGKNVFIGFSVHNDSAAGAVDGGGGEIFLFQRIVHSLIGHVHGVWRVKKIYARRPSSTSDNLPRTSSACADTGWITLRGSEGRASARVANQSASNHAG